MDFKLIMMISLISVSAVHGEDGKKFKSFGSKYRGEDIAPGAQFESRLREANGTSNRTDNQLFGFIDGSECARSNRSSTGFIESLLESSSGMDVPDEWDWRKEYSYPEQEKPVRRVFPVKDQGKCISGWAFAAVAVLEGQIGEHKSSWSGNQPGPLSEQQLLDCMENVSCGKHNGLGLALKYTARNGIASGRDYSYTASAGNCALLTNYGTEDITYPAVFGNIGYEYRTYIGLEDDLKKIVRAYGPVGILLPAKPLRDHESEGGVWEIESCRQYAVNHAAVIVGYGTKPKNHWIVKNSWGNTWNGDGYFKIRRGTNECGIAERVFFADFPKSEEKTQGLI